MNRSFILRADTPVQVVSMHALTREENLPNQLTDVDADDATIISEVIYVETKDASFSDPLQILERKILHLSRILDCSEAEATHIFLHSL